MFDIDEVEEILNELATELPQAFYKELNGGILLLPQVKMNPVGQNNDLYIMGEYHSGGLMGRYIVIYYESFMELYSHLGRDALKKELAHTLHHEFTHHLESLAGERGLVKKDERFLENYMRRKKHK